MKKIVLSITFASMAFFTMSAFSQTTVKWLHIDSDPEMLNFFNEVVSEYEQLHPDVKIELQYLENEAYKKKLTTLLQSDKKPDIIYSWGGGGLKEQVAAGVIEDLSQYVEGEWAERFYPAAVEAFKIDGKQYGIPYLTNFVGIYYNKAIFDKVGLDPKDMATWDGFLNGVKTLKNKGITPLVVGGADKWPLHFYWVYLSLRISGQKGFEQAMQSEAGFDNPDFIRAAQLYEDLIALEPFQKGFIGSKLGQSSGYIGDGNAAMVLQLNTFEMVMRLNSADKIGIPKEQLGWMPFPAISGDAKNSNDMLGGIAGWALTKGASKEAIDFMKFFTEYNNQKKAAERNLYLPVVKGTDEFLTNPIDKIGMQYVKQAPYFQVYYDQMLGAKAGSVMNDMSAKMALGKATAEESAKAVQEAWKSSNK